MDTSTRTSSNFSFLETHEILLLKLGSHAEQYFAEDPSTSLIKLRQYAEHMAQRVAVSLGVSFDQSDDLIDILRQLRARGVTSQVLDIFHGLRKSGNRAVHDAAGDHSQALHQLKMARLLGEWYVRLTTNNHSFTAPPFVPPPDPRQVTQELKKQLDDLRDKLAQAESVAQAQAEAASVWQRRALETEEQLNTEVEKSKEQLSRTSKEEKTAQKDTETTLQQANTAAENLDLDEADTRRIIDEQLRLRDWEVDTDNLRFSNGTRPVKGRNMAIAEWPTESGPADYALFVGTKCIAVVEAKRVNKNVSGVIDQAERYSRGFQFHDDAEAVGGPWHEFKIPFVFSSNGRPYLKQIETESGIWFRDSRRAKNLRRAIVDWPTPEGLAGMLEIDEEKAHEDLASTPIDFGFPLRPYQKIAIEKIEENLAQDKREMLVAMATGTGKTKLAIALLYRLLSAKRFRRICFVVDRSALGEQAAGEFKTTKVMSVRTFADTFGLKELADITPEPETKVHICTIQGLLKRVLYANDPAAVPPVDQYDLMVVDECHRGYLLDRELSDAELEFRSQDDYISKYRRVLEHFDAVKIGLTATPALHTTQIFGKPIYTYSYREAVVDGYLIDHEPPTQIKTELSATGIKYKRGDDITRINTTTGAVDLSKVSDELKYEVEDFNRKIITPDFNRVVAEELAKEIDPNLPDKTLVFAVSDKHADIVVEQLKTAFKSQYGGIEDAAVRKITGSVDRVRDLILSYRNDAFPKIAVTVDLLTTGVDVPKITNLVFIRRVNSRILYEQMLGRATRRCDEIDKETFRIFDAVDLYATLADVTTMKPVVVNPAVTIEQLFLELQQVDDPSHREEVRKQSIVKVRRRLKHIKSEAKERYEAITGETPAQTLQRLQSSTCQQLAEWLKDKPDAGRTLDWNPDKGKGFWMPISDHTDRVREVTTGYGTGVKPSDYLDSFVSFVRENANEIAALTVVLQRPRDLTRIQLRELRLQLDKEGFSETNLRRAWSEARNQDIAASIIGFVRQAALGDPLVPYEDRVKSAMERTLKKQSWTAPQKKWFQRICQQYTQEIVVDRDSLDSGQFKVDAGGFTRLNKVFNGQLESLLTEFNEEIWRTGA